VVVERVSSAVVAAGRARIGMPGSVLDAMERNAGLEGERHEGVAKPVGRQRLRNPGVPGDPTDDAGGIVAVERGAVLREEQRPAGPVATVCVNRGEGARRERHDPVAPALAHDAEDAMTTRISQVTDFRSTGLRDPQAVQGQQAHERVITRTCSLSGVKEPGELVAVEPQLGGVLAHAGTAHMHRGRAVDDVLLDGVAVEACERREAPRDRGWRPPITLKFARVELYVRSLGSQRTKTAAPAPCEEVTQIAAVGRTSALGRESREKGARD
jgi:hypothetical protein